MTRGRRPKPTAIRQIEGNRGKRAWNRDEPVPPSGLPTCPSHLSPVARREWRRVARALHVMGVLTLIDRAALAAYAQCYGRWVEAEEKLRETPALYKTPSGYVQQSPWLGISNRQLELMGRYMTELGMTPASRTRVSANAVAETGPLVIKRVIVDAPSDAVDRLRAHLDAISLRMKGPQDVIDVEAE